MAGVGFDLKKLFVGSGAIRKVRAYAYASIVCSGTMLLAVVLLLGIQTIAKLYGATDRESELLIALMVYALMGSLLLSSVWQILLSRYVADQLFVGALELVMPSLFGSSLLLMVPGGLLYGLFLSSAQAIPLLDRFLNWALFMELITIWLQMTYITAVKDYRRILRVFFAGVVAALLLGGLLLTLKAPVLTAMMTALVCGYGVMMIGFTRVLLNYFPAGNGSPFAFLQWISKTPELVWIGFFSMAGAFVHLVLMWFSPYGETVEGLFRHASAHDAAAFFAFLITIPANVNFVVSVEVNFYQKYKRYFAAVTDSGTLSELGLARDDMINVLQQEIFKLAQLQVFFMVAYSVLMRYFLETIGFTNQMIGMFQMMCIGYSAYAVGNSLMLLQLYFNDRRGALMTSFVFFSTNFVITLFTMQGSPSYYGIGLAIAGAAMYVAGLLRLMTYVRKIDYHVFCGQPMLAHQKTGRFTMLADRMENFKVSSGSKPAKRKEDDSTV